jgi:hypothetical protein
MRIVAATFGLLGKDAGLTVGSQGSPSQTAL